MGVATPAFASTIAQKKADAKRVQAQIDTLNTNAEIAAEAFNAARDRYEKVSARVRSTESRIAALKAHQAKLQLALNGRANQMYRQNGALGFVAVLVNAKSFDDFNTALQVVEKISTQDADTVSQLKVANAEAQTAHAQLKSSQASAKRSKNAMAAQAATVRTQLAKSKSVLAGVNHDIKLLLADQAARERRAAHARYLALLARRSSSSASDSGSGGGSDNSAPTDSVPPSQRGAKAVWWAMKAIGRPYSWGADGPGSFDCSGLCMWAYGHVGVSLPHSSRAQISSGRRVSRADLQPGDLVFFGSPIHHVGMYVGGGDFIEAPYSGANVRIRSLSRRHDYAGACRP